MLESKLPVIEEEKVDLSQVEDIIIDAKKNLQENIVIMAKPDDDLNRPAEPINQSNFKDLDGKRTAAKKMFLEDDFDY